MNYFDTKLLHLFAVFVMFLSITVSLYRPEKKLHKILSGIFSLIVLISGVLLLRRFGISHSGPFPAWVLVKMAIWLSVTIITPLVVKRFTKFAKFLYLPWIILIFIAIAMVIYKPL
jgi:cbb3-type cytochrome oxidase subunit 3